MTTRDLGGGYTAIKTAVGTGYARNGNLDSPTVYYRWTVHDAQGRYVGIERTLAGAKDLATIDAEEKA